MHFYILELTVTLNSKRNDVNQKLSFFPRICQKYEEITETIRGTPQTTEQLVTLIQFIKKTSEVTIHKLTDEIDEAAYRLCFLLDYTILPCVWNLLWFFTKTVSNTHTPS